MKRKIGISYTKLKFENYWNWIAPDELKDDLELVELSYLKNNIEDVYACDAFILTGGIDIDPSFYGGSIDYEHIPDSFSPERDHFEEKIYRYAQMHRLPLLGICRGIQLVNVLQGGKLIQDLGDDHNRSHYLVDEKDNEHGVHALDGSLLAGMTNSTKGLVNSAHHQAVDPSALGRNLKVSVLSEDKSAIEGLEFDDKSDTGFMLCVQWHPERMNDREENPFSKKLKDAFLNAVRATSAKKLAVINPATEEIINAFNEDSRQSLHHKFEILQLGKSSWQQISLSGRIMVIKKFSELVEKNFNALAQILKSEVGKPLKQAENEIRGARIRIKWLLENAERYLSEETMSNHDGMVEKIVYEPLGVVCNISAWNYPWLVGVNVFIPALLGGNCVMYKPSEYALLTGMEIEKLLKQAGIPSTAFQLAIGKGDVGKELLDLSFDGYFFTGSYKTGKYIYERVAQKMVPCQCEMGGKDPLYVADDINDFTSVAAATADGAFYNNGQSCCAVERIYVHENVYEKYLEEFLKEVRSWKSGSPDESDNYIGPLSRKQQLMIIDKQVKDAVKKGATILTGGKKIKGKGYFYEPTVLTGVHHEMAVMKEESFGPVIGIMKVKNDEEAIRLMQDTEYGLTAAVYCSDQSRAENILKQINAGTGYWNCCDRVSAALPWSGRKHSGFGTTLSHAGLRAFVKPKGYHLKGN